MDGVDDNGPYRELCRRLGWSEATARDIEEVAQLSKANRPRASRFWTDDDDRAFGLAYRTFMLAEHDR